jgi:hypothetical protein
MSHQRDIEAMAGTIQNAERCPDYYAEVGQCDGLDGCPERLELVAQAALRTAETLR